MSESEALEMTEKGAKLKDLERCEEAYHHTSHYFRDGKRTIDYVLVYENAVAGDQTEIIRKGWRITYEANLWNEGLETEKETVQDGSKSRCFIKIHATWKFLARQAELMQIKMPIGLCDIKDDEDSLGNRCRSYIEKLAKPFKLNKELNEPEYFSAPFNASRSETFMKRDNELIFTEALRSTMVRDILIRTKYDQNSTTRLGLEHLLGNGTFTAAFPLHQGSVQGVREEQNTQRQILFENWANPKNWYKYQPLDLIYKYYGETIGLYFAWLGFYTAALIPVALFGFFCIIVGAATLHSRSFFGDDICNAAAGNLTMCPVCDSPGCSFWKLKESCEYALATHVFDNTATLLFSILMAIWASFFLEAWKRYSADLSFRWDLIENADIEEKPHPAFYTRVNDWRINPVTGKEEAYVPYHERILRSMGSGVTVLFFLCLVLAFIGGITIYRVIIYHFMENHPRTQEYASFTTSATASFFNLIIIMVLSRVYKGLARKLTEFEYPRTESDFMDSYSLKVFCFEFINYYSSLFYIAFIKGRFSTVPGKAGRGITDFRLFGKYNMEQCDPSGCMVDLVIQLVIIMVGKQILNNIMEIIFPVFSNLLRNRKLRQKKKDYELTDQDEKEEKPQWERDLALHPEPPNMIDDYIEMVLQYGFVTLFVSAFPLAPFFALLNNIIEIRLDAYKFTAVYRRPTGQRAKDLGIWTTILAALSRIAVLTNACVIAFTSDFIPRMLYLASHQTIDGFIEEQLTFFNASALPNIQQLQKEQGYSNVTVCRFREQRLPPCGLHTEPNGPPESHACGEFFPYSQEYWFELAAKLAFVVVFQNFVYFTKDIVAYLVPDIPSKVMAKKQRQTQLIRESKEQYDKEHENTNISLPQDVCPI